MTSLNSLNYRNLNFNNLSITLADFLGHGVTIEEYTECSIEISPVTLYIRLYILKKDTKMETPILIGRNFTENHSIVYERINNTLRFSYKDASIGTSDS